MDLSLSGLASGFDWKSVVDQLVEVERAPSQRLLRDQNLLNQRNSAYTNVKSQLTALQSRIAALKNPSLFDSRAVKTSDASVASATVSTGAAQGSYIFKITQLATSSRKLGSGNVASPLSPDGDPASVTLSSAGFPVSITAGTFTVNGKQVSVATTDTLESVFTKISSATGGDVTAEYDAAEDKIRLTGSGTIVLGSGTDTSNFLQAARLMNNNTNTVSSSLALGSVRLGATLNAANFGTAVNDGGAGAGKFKINGVEIGFNASTDTVSGVLNRINNSEAGVTATYDSVNDRFQLVSKATGDIGIALEDVTGNFLAAAGLNTDAATNLERGKDLTYTVNGGDELRSRSNTITEASSGIAGLSITALKENASVTVTASTDTAAIKGAIQNFIEAYNKVQSVIDSQTASSTDANGVVTAGVLSGESDIEEIASRLRSSVFAALPDTAGTIKRLADLGIVSNGNDNSLKLEDSAVLDSALSTSLDTVKNLFSSESAGLATKLDGYMTKIIGEKGTLVDHQDRLTKQASDIDKQILDMERLVQANKERMTASFVSMETAQAKINQQLQYLLKNFSS
ncbi:MAG TPA: flagellar filament capping protein FliD [Verrucomicrobiae bacterium]|nr:flagellar filament capping protein FliD [Verrucomicrobiae bacterium]